MPALTKTVPTGVAPRSVAEHDGLVFVLATGDARDQRLPPDRRRPRPDRGRAAPLSTPDGAQVGFTPDGRALLVTERGGDKLSSYAVGMDGSLGVPRTIESLGATPYGFAISPSGTLVVTEAFRAEKGAAAASSYRVDGDAITPVTASVGNGRSEICWAVITNDGRFAFTTNFADGAVSRYAIGCRRQPHARGRRRGPHRPTGSRAFATRICPTTVGSCTRSTPTRAGSSAGRSDDDGHLSMLGSWEGCPRPSPGWRRADAARTLYRVTFTTPESWSVTLEGRRYRGTELPDRRGARQGRLSARYRAANFPRRRVDGALKPDFRGVLETDDGATILFHWEGLATVDRIRDAAAAGHGAARRPTTSATAG